MATKPIRQVTKNIVPNGANLILLDDGVAMGKASLTDAVTAVAGPLADTKIAALALDTASQKPTEFFATAAQGTKADSAVQPAAIGATIQPYSTRLKSLADATDGVTGQVVGRGADGSLLFQDAGSGDMRQNVYDPTGVGSRVVFAADTSTAGMGFVLDEDDFASDSGTKVPTQRSVNSGKLQKVATRTAMKTLDGAKHPIVELYEAGREGAFKWDGSDLSAKISLSIGTVASSASAGTLTFASHCLYIGQVVFVKESVAGLTAYAPYFVWRGTDVASNSAFKLATSRTNAIAGTTIDLSADASFTLYKLIDYFEGMVIVPNGKRLDGSQGAYVRDYGEAYRTSWWGVSPDAAENGEAINQAIHYVSHNGGGVLWNAVPGTYVVGDKSSMGRNIYPRSDVTMRHVPGVRYINRGGCQEVFDATAWAWGDSGSAQYHISTHYKCFWVIDGIAGNGGKAAGLAVREDPKGRSYLENFHFLDMPVVDSEYTGSGTGGGAALFVMFGDVRRLTLEPDVCNVVALGSISENVMLPCCRYEDLWIKGRWVSSADGTIPASAASIMNLFPGMVDTSGAEPEPSSKRLILGPLHMDVSGGFHSAANEVNQCDVCIKASNVDGVRQAGPITLIGGRTGALDIGNGARNLKLALDIRHTIDGVNFTGWGTQVVSLLRSRNIELDIQFSAPFISPTAFAYALKLQQSCDGLKVRLNSYGGSVYIYESNHRFFKTSDVSGKFKVLDRLTTDTGYSADVYAANPSSLIGCLIKAGANGADEVNPTNLTVGATFTTSRGAAGTITEVLDPNSFEGVEITGTIRNGRIAFANPASLLPALVKGLKIDLVIDCRDVPGSTTIGHSEIGQPNWPMEGADCKFTFYTPSNLPLYNYSRKSKFRIYSDGKGTVQSNSAPYTEWGTDNEVEIEVNADNTRHVAFYRSQSGASGLRVNRLRGPSSLAVANLNTAAQIFKGAKVLPPVTLDLSGSAQTVTVGFTDKPTIITGVEILYPAGSTADTGVSISVGYNGSASAVLSTTSLTSQSAGSRTAVGRTTGGSPQISGTAIPSGKMIQVSTAGGKTGADKVVVLLHAVELG